MRSGISSGAVKPRLCSNRSIAARTSAFALAGVSPGSGAATSTTGMYGVSTVTLTFSGDPGAGVAAGLDDVRLPPAAAFRVVAVQLGLADVLAEQLRDAVPERLLALVVADRLELLEGLIAVARDSESE